MKRDMELIRAILLKLEDMEMEPGTVWSLDNYADSPYIEGRQPDEISYNYQLMIDGGLLKPERASVGHGQLRFEGISWLGHDFLDAVRDAEIWRKTKNVTEKVGAFSFDMVKSVAVDIATAAAKHLLPALLP